MIITKHIPLLLFIISVVVDSINGFLQLSIHIESPIGILYRGALWLYLLISLARNITIDKQLVALFVLISVLSIWCIIYEADLFHELNYLIRYSYAILLFFYFRQYWLEYPLRLLYKYATLYGFLISSVIIGCFALGIGYNSYGDDYGWGTTGLFIAQNDLSLTIACTLIMSCIYYNKYNHSFCSFALVFFIGIGGILIGTRVCFISIPVIITLQGIIILNKKGYVLHKILISIMLVIVIPFVAWLVYLALDSYALAKLTLESLGNARSYLTDYAKEYIYSFDYISSIIGEGVGNLQHFVARGYSGVKFRMVEADLFELIGSYGFVLGSLIVLFYLTIAGISVFSYLQQRTIENMWLSVMFLLYVAIGYFAGHAASNVMAAPVFAIAANRLITPDYRNTLTIISKI